MQRLFQLAQSCFLQEAKACTHCLRSTLEPAHWQDVPGPPHDHPAARPGAACYHACNTGVEKRGQLLPSEYWDALLLRLPLLLLCYCSRGVLQWGRFCRTQQHHHAFTHQRMWDSTSLLASCHTRGSMSGRPKTNMLGLNRLDKHCCVHKAEPRRCAQTRGEPRLADAHAPLCQVCMGEDAHGTCAWRVWLAVRAQGAACSRMPHPSLVKGDGLAAAAACRVASSTTGTRSSSRVHMADQLLFC